jgi:acetyl-CoA carboxylase biotin carboxyl carrier protein
VVEVELRPANQPAQVEPAPSTPAAADDQPPPQPEQLHTIKSPIVGTFYSSPSPTSEAFVKIGDNVEPDSVVCIIEAMKLMNEIQAEVSGEVVKVLVENGQPVEYGQPLFSIRK